MSMFWSGYEWDGGKFYTADVVNHLATDWKSSVIRAAMAVEQADSGRGYVNNPTAEMNKVKIIVDAAIAAGIYVIVDYHTHYAENYQQQAITFFTEIAETYGNTDNIIYEIYNEPLNSTSWNTVKNYATPVIAAIRSKDPDNLIIVGTPTWSQDVHMAAASPITGDPNLAYTLHFYANSHKQWLRDRAVAAMNNGIALFVTEWGSVDASGNGGYNPDEARLWMDFMIDNNISHANWSVSDKNESASVIQPGQGIQGLLDDKLTDPGRLVKNNILAQAQILSTDEFTLNGNTVEIFPNPTRGILNINTESIISGITVYDINGKPVLTKKVNQDNPQINLEVLSTGNYVLKLYSKEGSASTKIIKSK